MGTIDHQATLQETERILADALEADRLRDEELCDRVSMAKVLDLFPEVKVIRVAQMQKIITPDGIWVYNPADGLFRNSEHDELNKIAFCGLLYGMEPEAMALALGSNPNLWRDDGEAEAFDAEPSVEEEVGYTFADLDLLLPAVSWLWKPWLPRGMLALVAGESGVGKSALALAIAAAIMQIAPWPDRVSRDGDPGLVVWVETESAHAITLERATKWGVPKNTLLIPATSNDPLAKIWLDTREGWEAVEREIRRDGVELLVLDSLRGAYRGDENASVNIELLNKLAGLAQRTQIAVLVVHHLRKRGMLDNGKIDLNRVRGSSAIVQIPRCVWSLDRPDPLTPDRVRLQQLKNNLARFPEPCGFEIIDQGITFTNAPTEPEVETQRDKAANLLMTLLRDGPVLATKIYEEGEGAALSKNTLRRAKEALGVVVKKREGRWWWSLPAKQNPPL